ncbi:MAG: hypothetical protein WC603_01275 [Candidatus Paceibacterota bacterium]|jgi:hypothetical protein
MEQKSQPITRGPGIPKNKTELKGLIDNLENKTTSELFEIIQTAQKELEEIRIEKEKLQGPKNNEPTTFDTPTEIEIPEQEQLSKEIVPEIEVSQPESEEDAPISLNEKDYSILTNLEGEVERTKNYINSLTLWKNHSEKKNQENKLGNLKEKLFETREIFIEKNKRPFIYYTFEKSVRPFILERYINKNTNLLDLRNLKSEEINPVLPQKNRDREGEVLFTFNIFGMILTVNGINKFMTKEFSRNTELNSEVLGDDNKQWKVIGPDGKTIKDNINWDEAREIYSANTENSKNKLITEFETEKLELLKTKEEKIKFLNKMRKELLSYSKTITTTNEINKKYDEKIAKLEA